MKNKFKIGDKVVLTNVSEENTGIPKSFLNNIVKNNPQVISGIYLDEEDRICYEIQGFYFKEEQLFLIEKGEDEKMNKIYFSKTKVSAKIPTKRVEDAGYDIYACFEEDYMIINPHETKMIPTGIASSCSEDYVFILKERGSNGSKGIAQRCGVIDSGYRNEWFVPLTNTTNKVLFISKLSEEETIKKHYKEICPDVIVYPYTKGVAQALLLPVPKVEVVELPYEELKQIKSERGMGALGSSGK